jgi:hypothetical protein
MYTQQVKNPPFVPTGLQKWMDGAATHIALLAEFSLRGKTRPTYLPDIEVKIIYFLKLNLVEMT